MKTFTCTIVIEETAGNAEGAAMLFAEDLADMVEHDAIMVINVLDPQTNVRTIVTTSDPLEIVQVFNETT